MFSLDCVDWNSQHVKFRVFDRRGANCGEITILTEDVVEFVRDTWCGNVQWNGKLPDNMEVKVAK